jgi:nicotinamide riboside transporter PnuC
MIRFLLLTIIPLILPFVGWFVWKVFKGQPRVDPQTGDQIVPDLERAPRGKLLIAGIVLMLLTLGTFLLIHDRTANNPYQPIDVDEVIEQEERERRQQNQYPAR